MTTVVITTTRDNSSAIGYSTSNQEKIGQSFKVDGTGDYSLSEIKAWHWKNGSPTDGIYITIETDNDGEPSGTLADVDATSNTIAGSSLTTSASQKTYTFSDVTLSKGTTYWMVWQRTGALSTSNFYLTGRANTGGYANGLTLTYDSSVHGWSSYGIVSSINDLTLEFTYTDVVIGPAMQINIGNTWKTVDNLKINIGDTWKDVVAVKINIGDSWKDV